MSDIDLLLRPQDATPARDLLRAGGFVEVPTGEPEFRSDWAPRGGQELVHSLELADVNNPWHVDLHVSLHRRFLPRLVAGFGSPDLAGLEAWRDFAQPVRVLPQPLLLAYLAFHASSHFHTMPLIRLVELALVVRRDFAGRPDAWTAFEALVECTGTGRFVYPALELTERLVPGTVERAVRKRLAAAAPGLLRAVVARTAPASAQGRYLHPFSANIIWAASLREGLAFLAEFTWPHNARGRVPLSDLLQLHAGRARRLVRRVLGRGPRG